MKKLAMLMVIPALVMFMVPAVATANWYHWWGILGTWEMVATGGCIHAPQGFNYTEANRTWTAIGTDWWTSIYVGQGTFKFDVALSTNPSYPGYRTGTMKVTQNCVHSYGAVIQNVIPPPPLNMETFPLYWHIEDDGAITVQIPNVGLELSGKIAMDYMSMTLVSMNQLQVVKDPSTGAFRYYQVCPISRVLSRVKE